MKDALDTFDWSRLDHELGERFDVDSIESSVRATLNAPGTKRLLVACSGGADSVFMLCLLSVLRAKLELEIHVAHFNHRWRGEASDHDADFVCALAKALGVPFYTDQRPENEAAFTETTARVLRLEFLRKAARQADCTHIAFGHNLDDILETQLQRIARGSATDGLAAPRPVARFEGQPAHLRPLLNLRSGDIRMAMNAIGIPWREDSSNEDTSIARNVLRHEVIPGLIDALNHDPVLGSARSRQLLEEDADALDSLAREQMPGAFAGEESLSRMKLSELPRALMRRALAAWLNAHGAIGSLSASAFDLLIDHLLSERTSYRQSAGPRFVCFDEDRLFLEEDGDEGRLQHVRFEPGEMVVLSNGYLIESEVVALEKESRDAVLQGEISQLSDAVLEVPEEVPLDVRSWCPGDRFHPLGAPGSRKLQDWFVDRRIPRKERKLLPVVTTASGEIIWVPGFPPAERLKINSYTKQALRLTYRPRKPR
jgi:tRNA(Ile)-lysidine synthase